MPVFKIKWNWVKFHLIAHFHKQDAISLARKVNQELNQFSRNMIKPYLPPQFAKLADISDDSKNFLFGDSVASTVESLRKED